MHNIYYKLCIVIIYTTKLLYSTVLIVIDVINLCFYYLKKKLILGRGYVENCTFIEIVTIWWNVFSY